MRALLKSTTARTRLVSTLLPGRRMVRMGGTRAARYCSGMLASETIVTELYDRVWSNGEYPAIERLVAARYVIHADPGDRWEGQALDHRTYQERVQYSRSAFPDLAFTVAETIGTDKRVAVRWSA